MARSYRGVGTIRWGAQDGKDGVNYLIMGWWSESVHYKLTDAGIPVVKVEDDLSNDGFSVYKLTALQSTLGTFIVSEWEKVKSADFVYMQDAYIERLQAVLITAERIEALDIVHPSGLYSLIGGKLKVQDAEVEGKITAKEGGNIGGFSVSGDRLVSQGGNIELDGLNNIIAIKDDDGSVRTLLTPNNIKPLNEYFGDDLTYYRDLNVLNTTYSDSSKIANIGTNLPPDRLYNLHVTGYRLSASADLPLNPGQGWPAYVKVESTVKVELLDNGVVVQKLASLTVTVDSNSPLPHTTEFKNIEPVFKTIKGGYYSIRVTHSSSVDPGFIEGVITSSSVSGMDEFAFTPIVNRSEVGSDGMVIATSKENYVYAVDSLFQVRKANVGFRVTSAGVQKSSNMQASTPTWDDIQ